MAVVLAGLLLMAVVAISVGVQALDEVLSRVGAVSFAHGTLLGFMKILACQWVYAHLGYVFGWHVVLAVMAGSLGFAAIKFRRSGTRWVFALNAGDLAGMVAGGLRLV